MIDPHLQAVLDAMVQAGFALPDPLEAEALRALLDVPIPGPAIEIAERRDLATDSDGRRIPARLYHPEPGAILPLTLFFHGGGWVHGTLETHDRLAAVLAKEAGCAVLSVAYRLAPEHPFPAAYEDALAVSPDFPAVLSAYGNLLDDLGESAEAVRKLARASELSPENNDYLVNLGIAATNAGQFDVAEQALGKAIRTAPGVSRGWAAHPRGRRRR